MSSTTESWQSNARKTRAKEQNMKITYYNEINETDFQVGVLGSRQVPYILNFSNSEVSCNCPDYSIKQTKPICKHIFLIIHLSKTNEIFNQIQELSDLLDASKISTIKENLLSVIDKKKLEANNGETNTISIERDDYCAVCMGDLTTSIEKCSQCEHVIHQSCLKGWWSMSSSWNSNKGKCPYCRANNGFSHLDSTYEDPWCSFDFSKIQKYRTDYDLTSSEEHSIAKAEEKVKEELMFAVEQSG